MYSGGKLNKILLSHGFTIIELLVVIVVIGILAAITIVSYTGISQKAIVASLTSDLDNAAKQLKLDQAINSEYPANLSIANDSKGIPASPGTDYQYSVDNTTIPQSFCITATKGSISYKITNDSAPMPGFCLEYNMVINLDAHNPASYPGTGAIWNDLSGNNNNASLFGGMNYSNDGDGSLIFDGVDDYGQITNNSSLDFSSGQSLIIAMKHSYTTGRKNPWNQAYGGYGTWTHENGININQYFGNSGINNPPYIGVTSATTPRDVWNILCATRDTNNFSWYINGALSSTRSNPYGVLANTAANIWIGNGYAGRWEGQIAVVIAYKRALNASEVQQIFNNLRGRYGL